MARAKRTSKSARGPKRVAEECDPLNREVLALPCREQDHYPFSLKFVDTSGDMRFPHASVRTTSWEWDGCGGRTDLHEMFGLLWALLLRVQGVASAAFMDEGGFGGPNEIYARALLFLQPFDRFLARADQRTQTLLRAHSARAAHVLYEVLGLEPLDQRPPEWQQKQLPWLAAVRDHLGGQVHDELFIERLNPNWRYYSSRSKGVTWLELPPQQMLILRVACRFYEPRTYRQGNRLVLTARGLHNAIALDALRRAEQALRAVEDSPFTRVRDATGRWDDHRALVVPLENAVVLIGVNFLVSVATWCGYRPYLDAREKWVEKNQHAAAIFGETGTIEWHEPIPSARFEAMVETLLLQEPNIVRVRSAGPHTERDQGRDIIVDRLTVVSAGPNGPQPKLERILVQVKTRNRTIGKGDVRDIRDTIEHHRAQGYMVVGYPRLSGDLVNHLDGLNASGLTVEWWARAELEERLRKAPHVVTRFSDVVTHRPPP